MVEPNVLVLVAAHTDHLPEKMSTAPFWNAVAQLGGSLGRRGDGPPGWKTLWKGWLRVQTWLEGVHLALYLPLSFVYKRQVFRRGYLTESQTISALAFDP